MKTKDRLLFITTGGVGDWFLSLPTMKIISDKYELYNLCMDNVINFAKDQSWIHRVIEYKISSVRGYSLMQRFLNFIYLVIFINYKGIKYLVLPVSSEGSIGLRNILRFSLFVKNKIGYNWKGLNGFLDESIDVNENEKDELQNKKILSFLNLQDATSNESFEVKKDVLDDVRKFVSDNNANRKFIVFHPYANLIKGKRKKWLSNEQYEDIMKLLETKLKDYTVYLVGHKKNLPDLENLASINPIKFKIFPPEKGLKYVAALLKLSELVLCVDGGIMHISATLGKKIVSIWGPTYLRRSYESDIWKIVRNPMHCFPCWDNEMLLKCEHMDCLHKIKAEDVVSEVVKLLSKSNSELKIHKSE